MSDKDVKANQVKAANRKIFRALRELERELNELANIDGMEYIETLTEVKMKIRKIK